MEVFMNELPAPQLHLDQVSATPATAIKRALFLANTFHLKRARILCLGDHDLTSVALSQLCPDLDITVVDVDERILAYLQDLSFKRKWNITALFSDLRVELPRSVIGSFDLVFSDPPYSTIGMRLFLQRAVQALKKTDFSRIVVCYGFGERQPGLGVKVQEVFYKLHLVLEAVLPNFNRYAGAQAIGSRSALYVCRPTRKTWPTVARVNASESRIYSHGREAEESPLPELGEQLKQELLAQIGEFLGPDSTLVGGGWPETVDRCAKRISLNTYLSDMYRMQGRAPFTKEPHSGVVIVNLYPHFGSYVIRLFLISAAQELLIFLRDEDLVLLDSLSNGDPLRRLISCKYKVRKIVRSAAGAPAFVRAEKVAETPSDGCAFVMRYLLDHRHARLGNAWREALIAWGKRQGQIITKNAARERILRSSLAIFEGRYLSELPLQILRLLVREIETQVEEMAEPG